MCHHDKGFDQIKLTTFDPLQPPSGSSWVQSLQDFLRCFKFWFLLVSVRLQLTKISIADQYLTSWRPDQYLTSWPISHQLTAWPSFADHATGEKPTENAATQHQWNWKREIKSGSKIALVSENKSKNQVWLTTRLVKSRQRMHKTTMKVRKLKGESNDPRIRLNQSLAYHRVKQNMTFLNRKKIHCIGISSHLFAWEIFLSHCKGIGDVILFADSRKQARS